MSSADEENVGILNGWSVAGNPPLSARVERSATRHEQAEGRGFGFASLAP